MDTADALFLEHGYHATSMREIAASCGVGLGLITYHYKTKFDLAKACLHKKFRIIQDYVNSVVNLNEDALLYHATYLRFSNWFFLRPPIRELYYEFLQEGIYGAYIYETVPRTLRELNRIYQAELPEDYILLYGNYLPADLEKTLVLQKRNGLFAQISFSDIPTIVFENAVVHFVADKALIQSTVTCSIELCKGLSARFVSAECA